MCFLRPPPQLPKKKKRQLAYSNLKRYYDTIALFLTVNVSNLSLTTSSLDLSSSTRLTMSTRFASNYKPVIFSEISLLPVTEQRRPRSRNNVTSVYTENANAN